MVLYARSYDGLVADSVSIARFDVLTPSRAVPLPAVETLGALTLTDVVVRGSVCRPPAADSASVRLFRR
jgi:hypothetical protein